MVATVWHFAQIDAHVPNSSCHTGPAHSSLSVAASRKAALEGRRRSLGSTDSDAGSFRRTK